MPTVGRRMRRAREAKGMTQQELARAVGKTRVTVSDWEHDRSRPRDTVIPQIARVLGIPASDLTPFGVGGVLPIAERYDVVILPVIVWSDLGRLATGDRAMDIARDRRDVPRLTQGLEDLFVVRVDDISMSPDFNPGDEVIVSRDLAPYDDCFVIAVLSNDGGAVLRRHRLRRTAVDLIPENPDYAAMTINDANPATIIGVVIQHVRNLSPPLGS